MTFNFFTVNFSGSGPGAFVSSRSEPISLSTLDQDCFIIPVRSLERFLPAGLPVTFNMSTQKKAQINCFKSFQHPRRKQKIRAANRIHYLC